MKVQTATADDIERVGILHEQSFSINFDAKMARILADGLYSDKVQSVIRELSCNAWDSHVMAGRVDTPFLVHFPTTLEPWFSVQDFGTGLSHDQVLEIYTRYGASTKTNSNEVIGQLGLGSKSPFALTSAFTVVTRKDGVENHYSMYRNERGMPCVAQLGQGLTNEPNGVTVQVPVRAEQRREFMDKAREVYKWFPIKPTVVGIDDLKIPKIEWAYQGASWRIRKAPERGWGYGDKRAVALMGMVAYPLDRTAFDGLDKAHMAMLSLGAVLEFSIGDLEVAANREALGYDERTVANIRARLDVMISELGAQFEQQISSAPTEYEARKRFSEIFGYHNHYNHEFRTAFGHRGLLWKGILIKESSIRVKVTDLYPLNKDKETTDNVHVCNSGSRRPRRSQHRADDQIRMDASDDTVIFFNDLERGGLSRVQEFNRSSDYAKNCFVFGEGTKITAERLSKAFGGATVVLTSSLPKPHRARAERPTHMLEWNGKDGLTKAWTEVQIDLNQGGFYVELDGWHIRTSEKNNTPSLDEWASLFRAAGILSPTDKIYAMRGKNRKLVHDDPSWKELFSTARAVIDDRIRTQGLAQVIADGNEYHALLTNSINWKPWETLHQFKLDASPMREFCDHVREVLSSSNQHSTQENVFKRLVQRFGIEMPQVKPRYQLVKEWQALRNRYPMIDFVGGRYQTVSNREAQAVFDYVDMVDVCDPFYRMQESR
jgi:hypothetical protein